VPRDDDDVVFGRSDEGAFRSTDRGDSWEPEGTGLPDLGNEQPEALVATSSTRAYVVGHGVVYRTTDGAATWTPLPGAGSEVGAIAADPTNGMRVLAANGSHVRVSTDGGDTWAPTGPGLPGLDVSSLAVGLDGVAHAGTDGAGVYELVA
jgi:photosystem II stability/assembly factor-like uncharacterized protein